MSHRYEDKQNEISEKIKVLRTEMDKLSSKSVTADMFIATVRKYTRAKVLTPRMLNELIESYRALVLENIGYDDLIQDSRFDRDMLDEITELIVDTVCSARQTIRIAGDDYPAEVVKSRFLKLDSSHVQYVMDCMKDNTTYC